MTEVLANQNRRRGLASVATVVALALGGGGAAEFLLGVEEGISSRDAEQKGLFQEAENLRHDSDVDMIIGGSLFASGGLIYILRRAGGNWPRSQGAAKKPDHFVWHKPDTLGQ